MYKKAAFSTNPSDYDDAVEPPPPTCTRFNVTVHVPSNINFLYTDCNGVTQTLTLNSDGMEFPAQASVCCYTAPVTGAHPGKYTIEVSIEGC